ncbi:uncharacterized protein LOC129746993 [Uranotaenia lowii]|uniref:uncharacterized protein LOC129746993 n=1 Tax=Uranotaenia lowii TaxID=190385 RepID=UPI00247B218A|nr:uncharacterized protein LOC129746993 [Uranotaenia lowii]
MAQLKLSLIVLFIGVFAVETVFSVGVSTILTSPALNVLKSPAAPYVPKTRTEPALINPIGSDIPLGLPTLDRLVRSPIIKRLVRRARSTDSIAAKVSIKLPETLLTLLPGNRNVQKPIPVPEDPKPEIFIADIGTRLKRSLKDLPVVVPAPKASSVKIPETILGPKKTEYKPKPFRRMSRSANAYLNFI